MDNLLLRQVLTEEQIKNVLNFYVEHQDYVRRVRQESDASYEPSEWLDKNDPWLWKAGYWNWFFEQMHEERGLPIPDKKIKSDNDRLFDVTDIIILISCWILMLVILLFS